MAETETEQVQDTEITLGTGKLLGIFFGLVLICAFFFTMGYLLGRNSGSSRSDTVAAVPGTSGNATAKPTAADKPSNPDSSASSTVNSASTQSRSAGTEASTAATQGSTASSGSTTAPAQSSASTGGSEVKTGSGGSLMVQVAAVSKQEDADILVSALRKKQYPVFVASSPSDPLFHVQVGPFADPKDAEAMKSRLVGDGYNAIVKR